MARTPSTMPELGRPAPDFDLPDTEGNRVRRADYTDRPLLVMFICNHCPFVVHVREELVRLARDYADTGLAIVAINSNDAEAYSADNPEAMKREKAEVGYPFPYLFDETQAVAKAYDAACTPDFFLHDPEHRLFYRGQLDASRPGKPTPVNGEDLREAIDALLASKEPPAEQRPSLGCNIKWKPGNETEYY